MFRLEIVPAEEINVELRSASLWAYVIVYFKVFFRLPLYSICIVMTILCDHAVLNWLQLDCN